MVDLDAYLAAQMIEVNRLIRELETAKTMLSLKGPVHHQGDEKLYIVEKVLSRTKRNGRFFYKVKWLGFEDTTFEPVNNLPDEVVRKFDAVHPRPKRRKSKTKK